MIIRRAIRWTLLVCGFTVQAEGQTFNVPTRPGVETTVYWEAQDGAEATVFMVTGGNGGYGKVVDGKPSSCNFLARSVALFLADGAATFAKPCTTTASSIAQEKEVVDLMAEWMKTLRINRNCGQKISISTLVNAKFP